MSRQFIPRDLKPVIFLFKNNLLVVLHTSWDKKILLVYHDPNISLSTVKRKFNAMEIHINQHLDYKQRLKYVKQPVLFTNND